MQIFALPTFKTASEARIWLPQQPFQIREGFWRFFSMTNNTCKKSEIIFRMFQGIGMIWALREWQILIPTLPSCFAWLLLTTHFPEQVGITGEKKYGKKSEIQLIPFLDYPRMPQLCWLRHLSNSQRTKSCPLSTSGKLHYCKQKWEKLHPSPFPDQMREKQVKSGKMQKGTLRVPSSPSALFASSSTDINQNLGVGGVGMTMPRWTHTCSSMWRCLMGPSCPT